MAARVGQILFAAHVMATTFMCGLIWFVQVVHYPMFLRFAKEDFNATMQMHQQRTGLVVAPVMLLELGTGILLLWHPYFSKWVWTLNLLGIAIVWLSTGFAQVPLHRRLEAGYDLELAAALVRSNWLRTMVWTVRSAWLGWVLTKHLCKP